MSTEMTSCIKVIALVKCADSFEVSIRRHRITTEETEKMLAEESDPNHSFFEIASCIDSIHMIVSR